jgi:hypothetical protein
MYDNLTARFIRTKLLMRALLVQVLMMAPTAFQSNMQAAQDNYFMAGAKGQTFSSNEAVRSKVLEEYRGLYHVLTQEAGLKVGRFHLC